LAACPALVRGKLDLNSPDRSERDKAVGACRAFIDQAYELGARILVVASGPDPGGSRRAEGCEILVDSLKQLCRYAQEQVQDYLQHTAPPLAGEPRAGETRAKGRLGPTHGAAGVTGAVKAEYSNTGLTPALSHQPLLREPIPDMLVEGADTMIHGHFGNCVV